MQPLYANIYEQILFTHTFVDNKVHCESLVELRLNDKLPCTAHNKHHNDSYKLPKRFLAIKLTDSFKLNLIYILTAKNNLWKSRP